MFSFLGIYYHHKAFNLEPGEGFETRGTELAGQRLALDQIEAHITSPSGYFFDMRKKREIIENTTTEEPLEESTYDYNDYGKEAEAVEEDLNDVCVQYYAIGEGIPYLTIDPMAKLIFEVSSIEELNVYKTGENAEKFYETLLEKLEVNFTGAITLKGAYFEQKLTLFRKSILPDVLLGGVSLLLVLICFLLYSRSFLFTGVILATVLLSLTTAYAIYTLILALKFFPFVNLLTLVLMVSIGADDAFLLLVYLREEKRLRKPGSQHFILTSSNSSLEKPMVSRTELLRASLPHSLISMFVTSSTTCIAFISNLSSPVIVVRCFGIYATLTIAINYILVLLLLPAAMSLTQCGPRNRYSNQLKRLLFEKTDGFYEKAASRVSAWIFKLRYLGLFITLLTAFVSLYALLVHPGIQLPESNPMQYLRSSHPYEWFDDHRPFFCFEKNRNLRHTINYVRGINPNHDSSSLNPFDEGVFSFSGVNLTTVQKVEELQDSAHLLRDLNPDFADRTMWIDEFLEYIGKNACEDEDNTCCTNTTIDEGCFLKYAKRSFCQEFPLPFRYGPADCPLFDKEKKLKAYFISVPSQQRLSLAYSKTKALFKELHTVEEGIKAKSGGDVYLLLSESHVTKMYDLLSKLLTSTMGSVLVSVAVSLVVIIACTWDLSISLLSITAIGSVILNTLAAVVWMGWRINVVEATITVLSIGLSFDYTLHYAVAHRHAHDPCIELRIRSCNNSAGRAVLAGAVTSILAGLPMLSARTNAFYQIGCFMIVISLLSLVTGAFLFPSLLAVCLDLRCWRRKNVKIEVY
ncbi:unnamed protein product, partial [Mesorhabditis spiculigera]